MVTGFQATSGGISPCAALRVLRGEDHVGHVLVRAARCKWLELGLGARASGGPNPELIINLSRTPPPHGAHKVPEPEQRGQCALFYIYLPRVVP